MATRIKVRYQDGREFEVLASPKAQIMTERHFKGIVDANNTEASYYLAWASLHYAGKEPAEFESWIDLVLDASEVDPDAEEADPTNPSPSTTGSFDSASQPDSPSTT